MDILRKSGYAMLGSAILALGTTGYFGYKYFKNIDNEEKFTKRDANLIAGGLVGTTALFTLGGIGLIKYTLDEKVKEMNEKKLEGEVKN
jgi:hypothetical protein